MFSEPRPKPAVWLIGLLLLAATLLAWWPLLLSRPSLVDDYLIGPMLQKGFGTYWSVYGIWRSAGHPLPFWLGELFPGGDAIGALVTQMVAVAVFYALLRRLVVAEALRIAAALIFAVMPFGFQALTWNSALSFALSTIFAMAALLVTLRPLATLGQGTRAGLLAALLGFLSVTANEASLLLVGWIAFYQIMRGGWTSSARPHWIVAALILLSEAAWVPLHFATRHTGFHKNVAFHVPAIVSGLVRQYQQITYFTHLPKLGAWLPPAPWASAAAVLILLIPLWRARSTAHRSLPALEAIAFALLPIAAVAVYALGGGFSLDARKAYPIWPFLLLSIVWFLQAGPAWLQRGFLVIALALAPLMVLSSQATTRAWQQTAGCFETANRQINEAQWPGPYAFRWSPDVYAAWPDFDLVSGFRFDLPWVLEYAVGQPALQPGPPQTTLEWQPSTRTWKPMTP